MNADVLLIGVDGGATEVKAHEVRCRKLRTLDGIELGPASASRVYPRLEGFTPVAVAEQLARRDAGDWRPAPAEEEQGGLWIEAAADCTAEVARQAGGEAGAVLVGMGMPGLKRADRRGIVVLNNGPRIPDFLDLLESALKSRGIRLAAPIAELGSDADYCGLGEQYAADGLFRDVQNAYYLGGGTGVADAMKLGGRLVTFDESREWILKSWQMPSALGPTFEKLVSAKSLNDCFAAFSAGAAGSRAAAPPVNPPFVEEWAVEGDLIAHAVLDVAALLLAELIFERMATLYRGRADAPHRGPAYAGLRPDHPYLKTVLERVVIGQRIGAVFDSGPPRFASRVYDYVEALLIRCGDGDFAEAYLERGSLRPDLMVSSTLRAAPALGAAVSAARAYAGAS